MDVLFASEKWRKGANSQKKLVKRHGAERAKIIRRRLDDLAAAENLGVMRNLPGRCHEEKGDLKGILSLDLDGPYRLFFEPAHDPVPCMPHGGLDWSKVTAVRILRVEDPHGKN
ncbi:MAG: killer suppression protein [bacterium]